MRKGFTLVELAIVVVIIGVILTMALKSRTIVNSAEVRADISKLTRMSTAIMGYYVKFNEYPGQILSSGPATGGANWSNMKFYNDLVDNGFLSSDDFFIDLIGRYINVAGCDIDAAGWPRELNQNFDDSANICAYVSYDNPATLGVTNPVARGAGRFACYVESMLDNSDLMNGFATGIHVSGDNPDFHNCDSISIDNITHFSYVLY